MTSCRRKTVLCWRPRSALNSRNNSPSCQVIFHSLLKSLIAKICYMLHFCVKFPPFNSKTFIKWGIKVLVPPPGNNLYNLLFYDITWSCPVMFHKVWAYREESLTGSSLMKSHSLVENKAQNITDPPPCLTIGIWCFLCLLLKSSILVPSD